MKRVFLAFACIASSYALFAQQTGTTQTGSTTDMNNMNSSNSYNAYSAAPSSVQLYFTRDYPMASNVTWMQNNEWWRASYNTNGRYNHVYYNTNGDHYLVALPVTQTLVPDAVISKASDLFGANVYDITALKGMNGMDVYQVRLLNNGQLSSEWYDANGNKITEYWRTDAYTPSMNTNSDVNTSTNTNMSTDMNTSTNAGTETKVKTKVIGNKVKTKTIIDGKKTKTKTTTGTDTSTDMNQQ